MKRTRSVVNLEDESDDEPQQQQQKAGQQSQEVSVGFKGKKDRVLINDDDDMAFLLETKRRRTIQRRNLQQEAQYIASAERVEQVEEVGIGEGGRPWESANLGNNLSDATYMGKGTSMGNRLSDTSLFLEKLERLHATSSENGLEKQKVENGSPNRVEQDGPLFEDDASESLQKNSIVKAPDSTNASESSVEEAAPVMLGFVPSGALRINSCVGPIIQQLLNGNRIVLRRDFNPTLSSPSTGIKLNRNESFDTDITYKDQYGRILTPKDAYRLLSHRFHGKAPGKMKTDKYLRKIQLENEARKHS